MAKRVNSYEKTKESVAAETKVLFSKLFEKSPQAEKVIADDLVVKAAWINGELFEIMEIIERDGATISYTGDAGYKLTKKNPALDAFNGLMTQYKAVIKQLISLLPEDAADDEALSKFLDSIGA